LSNPEKCPLIAEQAVIFKAVLAEWNLEIKTTPSVTIPSLKLPSDAAQLVLKKNCFKPVFALLTIISARKITALKNRLDANVTYYP
jgi:hypothetical protein